MNEDIPPIPTTKRTPPGSVLVLPVRQPGNGDITSTNNSNGKAREQPPELPPKTARVVAAGGKMASSNMNPTVNRENQSAAAAAVSEPVIPPREAQPIQRHKSKSHRRKMTEEEAIKELG
jgi:hypothetical protein